MLVLEPDPGVEGSELLLLPADSVPLFSNLEMAAGRACSSGSVSLSVIDPSSVTFSVTFSSEAPGWIKSSVLLLLLS
jgi:hypothetical protein